MAKLDGVKVVNENTVEYNGFVYGLVTGDAKVDDLVKASEQELDVTEGAFYLITGIDEDGDIKFYDDANDGNLFYKGQQPVFRNSHAITTDKLTDAEGVVKIELPDGTKLEGTPSDLEKITRSMQKMQAEQGVSVEMKAEVEDGNEPVPERLQVGDYAKVVGNESDVYEKGSIVKITDVPYGKWDYQAIGIKKDDEIEEAYEQFFERELVKATGAEVLEAKQALLKEGDFARVIANTSNHRFEIGTVVKLKSQNSTDSFTAYYLDESDFWGVYREDLEPLTKEETEHITREAEEEKKAKAERAKWAAIGREVGEIKDGNIVLTVNYGIVEITSINDEHFRYSYDNKNGDRDRLSKDATLELIVPVEQRFDTVG